MNATSFALREAIEDEPAFERALRLVGRLLEARWVQTLLTAEEDAGLSMLVAAEPDAEAPATAADDLLLQVVHSSVAVFSELEAPESEVEAGVPAALGGYAVVPLTSKGESLGVLAVYGRDRGEWSEAERRLLMLLGREFSATLDHLSLYRATVGRARREALLNTIGQAMSAIADAEEAVAHGLELAAGQLGALTMSVVASRDGELRPRVVAHVHSRPGERGERGERGEQPRRAYAVREAQIAGAWRAALLAAPALTRDRAAPLVLGAGGEATISRRLAGEGVATLVVAPMRTAHAASGALVVSAPHGVVWERASVELVSRLAELIALRLQSAELARLQRRRIAELAGLAEIGHTVQSTVDLDRLLREFTVAVHKLQPLVAVHLARLSEDGTSAEVTTISEPGTALGYLSTVSTDESHAWFALRQTRVWSRGREQPPSFLGDEHAHCVVVPLRAKGRVLGVAAMVTPAATTPDEQSLIEQAVAQARARQRLALPAGNAARGADSGARQPGADRRIGGRSAGGVRRVRRGGALADPVRARGHAAGRARDSARRAVRRLSARRGARAGRRARSSLVRSASRGRCGGAGAAAALGARARRAGLVGVRR